MSGSSLDGLDIAQVRFSRTAEKLTYSIVCSKTIPYPDEWRTKLTNAFTYSERQLKQLDLEYGEYLGKTVADFLKSNNLTTQYVASHGHTVFHKPEQRYTLQIGDGQSIANACGHTVINDFRSEDVSKGGQGAPLVPIGDKLLFADYPICLNIGGIANVSYDIEGKRIAYDICIANQMLNDLSHQVGLEYDKDGDMARSGKVSEPLLRQLNDNTFYTKPFPKSLGREFFESHVKPYLNAAEIPLADKMSTCTEHIAMMISSALSSLPKANMLVTGGGALNKHLIQRIQSHTHHTVVIPDRQTIDYKEALIFALLGMLRIENQTNVLCSVTGASSDSSSGNIWRPK